MLGFYDLLAIILLIFAISVNSFSVYIQKKYKFYDRFEDNGYAIHNLVISFAWGTFIVSEFFAARSEWRLADNHPLIGYGVMAIALAIFILALRQIGRHALGNGNFFGKPLRRLGGIYKVVPEPIYVSYSLWFLGIGLASSLKVFFVLSFIGFIGLVFLEARIERPDSS